MRLVTPHIPHAFRCWVVLVAAIAFVCGPAPARAAELTWDNGEGNGLWDPSSTNWSGPTTWNSSPPDSAVFDVTGAGTVTLDEPIVATGLTFNAAGYTIAGVGNPLAMQGDITANESAAITAPLYLSVADDLQYWVIANGKTLSLNNVTGQSGVRLNIINAAGDGNSNILNLTGSVDLQGNRIILQGTRLDSSATGSIVSGNNYVLLGHQFVDAVVNITGGNLAIDAGTGKISIGTRATSTVTVSAGTLSLTTTGASEKGVVIGGDWQVGDGGAGVLTVSGSGLVQLSSPDITFAQIDTTPVGGETAASGTLNLDGGALETTASFVLGSSAPIGTGTINFNGGTLRATGANADWIGASVACNVKAGGAKIDTQGNGTLTLTGVNTYTGDTKVEAGALSLNNAYLADGADAYLAAGATLNLNHANTDTIRSLYIGGDIQATGTWGRVGLAGVDHESAAFTGNGMLNVTVTHVPATLYWDAPTGDYGAASNWVPEQIPTSGDDVRIDNGGTAGIPNGNHQAGTLYVGSGNDTSGNVSMSGGSLTVVGNLYTAFGAASTGNVSLSGSSVLNAANISLGARGTNVTDVGPSASVIVSSVLRVGLYGPDVSANLHGDATFNLAGTATVGQVIVSSNGGIGRFNLNGGGLICSGAFDMDDNAGYAQRSATLTVTGSAGAFGASGFSGVDEDVTLAFIADAGGFTTLDVANAIDIDGATITIDADAYAGTETYLTLMDGAALNGTFAATNFTGSQTGWIIYDRDNGDLLFSTQTNVAPRPLSANPLFQDDMVLQRDMDVPVWGRAAVGAEITVRLDGVVVATAISDVSGKWLARIGSHPDDGGQAHTLRISTPGAPDILIDNVVFGEVYLALGQSNMNYRLANVTGAAGEIASADYPLIRQITVQPVKADTEQEVPSLNSGWTRCSPAVAGTFTAVGYFCARSIYVETGVPVGLVFMAAGGQPIEQFMCPEGMTRVPGLTGMLQYEEEDAGIVDSATGEHIAFGLCYGSIAPLSPYGVRGAIFYQGERNAVYDDGDIYRLKMLALMRGLRSKWGQNCFSFYFVQLPNHTNSKWPVLREAQFHALAEPDSGMAVTMDVGETGNLHPPNKQDPGYRLARWALARDLQRDVVYSGPLYHRTVVEGARIRVLFDHAEGGLMIGTKDSTNPVVQVAGPLQNFQIAPADKVFVDATATIDADTVLVSSPSVAAPVYLRYCYVASPTGANQLYNVAGLPASPFRTDSSYDLRVISGSGSIAGLAAGTQRTITANAPAGGEVFDRWIGAASAINDFNASSTTVTMPDRDLYLLAAYRAAGEPAYILTVNSGYGSGTSKAGSLLNIEAHAAPAGQVFNSWSGDTQTVVNVHAASTTLRMPSGNATLTAIYRTEDSVGDGISDSWRVLYFGGDGSTTNAESCATCDPDHDGANNLQEHRAGSNPTNATSRLYIDDLRFQGDDIEIDFTGFAGHRYILENAKALTSPEWGPVVYNIAGDGAKKHVLVGEVTATTMFFRLSSEIDGEE